jgi:dihydrofolate reductase
MKLTTMTQITIDGVMQGNGGTTDEERARNGFERGGWARGQGDSSTDAYINDTYARAEAFLFGRRTYELFARSWGAMSETDAPGWEATWRALDTRPKYVASTTLTDPAWAGTTVLPADPADPAILAAAVAELKARPGGELQVHGSGILTQWLLANGLVDELTLVVVPVILGQGARLFPEAGPDIALDLLDSRVDSNGVSIQVYRPAGRPAYFGAN